MTDTRTAVVAQLRALEHLTRTEIALARTRTAQARTAAVREELLDNAAKAEDRSAAIADALRELGTVPDVVAPAVGWLGTLVKGAVEQTQPIDEALLGDLALEHQLADRARYLKALTRSGPVHDLADRLVAAHTETIEWLQGVLAQEAGGGPTALAPTPLQAVAAGVGKAAQLPVRLTVEGVNKAADRVQAGLGRIAGTASTAGQVLAGGLESAARRAEETDDGDLAHAVRRETGGLAAAELPIPTIDQLSVADASVAVARLRDPADVRAVQRYEERHKNRRGVLNALREQAETVARNAGNPRPS